MDIHPPEHPIRSFRDFAVQIFTVTCGIIIALGLEALVVHRHEARLLRETRAEFSAEIQDSIDKLQSVHGLADRDIKWMVIIHVVFLLSGVLLAVMDSIATLETTVNR